MKNSPIGFLVGGVIELMKHFEPLEKIIDKTGNAIKKLFGWKGVSKENYDVKVSNTIQNTQGISKQNKVAEIKLGVNTNSVEEAIKKIKTTSQNVKIDSKDLKDSKASSVVTANKTLINPLQQNQQIKKDVKNDIKQTFTYNVSVSVNNQIDEEELAQKISNKTMAESKNAILNGFRLAGLE